MIVTKKVARCSNMHIMRMCDRLLREEWKSTLHRGEYPLSSFSVTTVVFVYWRWILACEKSSNLLTTSVVVIAVFFALFSLYAISNMHTHIYKYTFYIDTQKPSANNNNNSNNNVWHDLPYFLHIAPILPSMIVIIHTTNIVYNGLNNRQVYD